MKVNGRRIRRIWEVSTDHSIEIGKENSVESLAGRLDKVLDENNIDHLVKYSDYRLEVEVFSFGDMCSVVKTLDTLMEEKKYKLTGIKVTTNTY